MKLNVESASPHSKSFMENMIFFIEDLLQF